MKKKRFFRGDERPGLMKLVVTMKLTTLLLFLSMVTMATGSYSQNTRFSLNVKDATILQVLEEIERQTEFGFLFKTDQLDMEDRYTVNLKEAKIENVMNEIIDNEHYSYRVMDRIIVISKKDANPDDMMDQNNEKVSGKVSDSSGLPLPGVTIMVKGTTTGTVTDANGEYALTNVPEDAILQFSFVGMRTQEVAFDGKVVINVQMEEDAIGLDEVVAVGYGTVKKQDLTGSVSSMKSDAILNRPITSLSEAFAGKLAGVLAQSKSGSRPGDDFQINIRGINSINASSSPLVVIDGIAGSMSDINPNDIESVEILKDASSAAIYGARGASGVILVTTQKGKTGKPSFDVNITYGLQKVDRIMPMMNRDEFIAWQIYSKNQGWILAGGNLSTPLSERGVYSYPESFLTNPESLPDISWQEAILQTAPIQNYQISASGGGSIGNYYISASYINQEGIMKYTDYDRFTLRMNTILNIGKNFKIGMNLAPSTATSNNPMNNNSGVNIYASTMAPIVPLDMNTEESGYTEGAWSYPNPLLLLEHMVQEDRNNKFTSTLWGELKLLKYIKLKSQFGYNFYNYKMSYYRPPTYFTNNELGQSQSNESYFWSVQNTLEYAPKISELIEFKVLVGQSIEGTEAYTLSGQAKGYPNEMVHTLNVATIRTSISSTESENALNSYFGRLTISAEDKYLLALNLRRDGSSKFGRKTKWGWFPSASAGWKINKEEFMQQTSGWLDLLKLRVLYGKAGNNGIGDYESIAGLSLANYTFNGVIASGLAPSGFGNDLLGWETKISKGIGLDIVAFRNRIQANIDFYMDDTDGMLLNVPITYLSGYSQIRKNVGKVRNKGIEFELTTRNITGRLSWSTSVNVSKNINEVLKLGDDGQPIIVYYGGATTNITKIGEPIGSYYMYKTDGLLLDDDFDKDGNPLVPIAPGQIKGNLKIVDVSKDGKISTEDNTIVGSNMPDYVWGLTNNFNYKNFDLSVFLQGTLGGELFFEGARHLDLGQSTNPFNQFKRWLRSYKVDFPKGENPFPQNTNIDMSWDGKTPTRFGSNPFHNDTWIYDGSYVRIKNITVGYNFSDVICKKLGIGYAKIYLTGENIHTFTKYPGYAVDSNSSGNSSTKLGTDYVSYPLAKTYSLGINVKF